MNKILKPNVVYRLKLDELNSFYHNYQAHNELLYLQLITYTKHNTISSYKSCPFTFDEYLLILVLQSFLIVLI